MFRVHRDFKGLLKAAQDEYDSLVELNESLRKKVAEWNKDEEIRKAVELAEYNRTHSLCQISDNEKKAERAFRDSHYKSCKNGSKYLYELTGTGIGTAITSFGDLWVVDGASFIKINNGYAIELDEPEGFIKVGHIDGVINKRSQPTK